MTPSEGAPGTPVWWREELRYLCELLALTGLAIAQPVLDVFGNSPETFAFRGVSRAGIIEFALLVTLLPPLVLGIGAAITRFAGRRVRRWVQVVMLSALAGLLGVQIAKSWFSWTGAPVAVFGVVAAVGFALLYARVGWARLWVSYLAPAPIIFMVLFLVASPAAKLVSGSGSAAAVGLQESDGPDHIVVLMLDEFPTSSIVGSDGEIDAALYPNLARLAGGSTWYRNYSTAASSTTFAVPSVLTGSYPKDVDVPVAADYPDNLFTLLGDRYTLDVDETFTRLCPDDLCTVSATGSGGLRGVSGDAVDVWRTKVSLDDVPAQIAAGFAEEKVDEAEVGDQSAATQKQQLLQDDFGTGIHNAPVRFEEFLAGIKGGEAPSLHYLHLLKPHQPWEDYPSGTAYPYPSLDPGRVGKFGNIWGPSEAAARLGRQRHLLQAQYSDRLVGQTLDRLEDQGILDDTLLVVMADHGIAFEPDTAVRAEDGDAFPESTWSDIMWAPLFVKAPGQTAGSQNDWNVESIDVLPTIADLAGIEIPWKVDGKSAADGPPRSGQTRAFYKATISPDAKTSRGPRFTVDGDDGLDRMISRGVGNFAAAGDPKWALYRVGPDGDLVGRKVTSFPTVPATGVRAEVDDPGQYADVQPRSGTVPGLVSGRITGTDGQVPIAIALNGTIGAATSSFATDQEPHRFAGIMPDFLFRRGKNTMTVYEIVDRNGSPGPSAPHRVAGKVNRRVSGGVFGVC